jgi:hypothetical protein
MPDSTEIEKLQNKIKELEQQLAEEREEFQWDIKAAKESSENTVKKLQEELQALKAKNDLSKAPAGQSSAEEVLTSRALMAERRLAEVEQELKRVKSLSSQPVEKTDTLMRQRAESAEAERDELRKSERALKRTLEEKEKLLLRSLEGQNEAKGVKRQLEKAKKEVAEHKQELRKMKASLTQKPAADQPAEKHEIEKLTLEVKRLSDLETKYKQVNAELEAGKKSATQQQAELKKLKTQIDEIQSDKLGLAQEVDQLRGQLKESKGLKQPAGGIPQVDEFQSKENIELKKEVDRLNQELARLEVASGQMVQQRERETERLKTDLRDANEKQETTGIKIRGLNENIEQLKQELAEVKKERDQLLSKAESPPQGEPAPVSAAPETTPPKKSKFAAGKTEMGVPPSPKDESVPDAELTSPAVDLSPTSDIDGQVEPGQDVVARIETVRIEEESVAPETAEAAETTETTGTNGTNDEEPPADAQPLKVLSETDLTPYADEAEEQAGQPESVAEESMYAVREPTEVIDRDKLKKGGLNKVVLISAISLVVVIAGVFILFGSGDKEEQTGDDSSPAEVAEADEGQAPVDPVAAVINGPDDGGVTGVDGREDDGLGEEPSEPEETAVAEEEVEISSELQKAQKKAAKLIRRRKHRNAVKYLKRYLAKFPSDATLHLLYGQALQGRKKSKAAGKYYQKAIELDPQLAEAHYYLGLVSSKLKKKRQACKAYKQFVELSPQDSRIRRVRGELRKLRCR